jgi:hypothetical protein
VDYGKNIDHVGQGRGLWGGNQTWDDLAIRCGNGLAGLLAIDHAIDQILGQGHQPGPCVKGRFLASGFTSARIR